jgi:hypothetical protein
MAKYNPPTRVITIQQPFLALVTQADPGWAQRKHYDIEYLMDHRALYADPYQRGAYNRRSNVYPVGAQYGGLDPLVINNLAPTVGNATPGLYSGIPDGKGWA